MSPRARWLRLSSGPKVPFSMRERVRAAGLMGEWAPRQDVDTFAEMDKSSPVPAREAPLFHELSLAAWVVDVTDWGHPVDREVLRRIGDPALVCFGGHDGVCPIGRAPDGITHDVEFEIVGGREADAAFVGHFRRQLPGRTVRVHRRPPAPAATTPRPSPPSEEN